MTLGADVALSTLSSGHPSEPQGRIEVVMLAFDLRAVYAAADRFGVGVRLPVRTNVISVESDVQPLEGMRPAHEDDVLAGVGDLVVDIRGGMIRPREVDDLRVDLRFGLSLPTGRVDGEPPRASRGGVVHQHVFFGSGTVMPVFGLNASYSWPDVTLAGWVDARWSLYEGPTGYKPSSLVASGLGLQSDFGLNDWRFLLQQEVFYEDEALWDDRVAGDTGRVDLIATAGVFWRAAEDWQVHLLVKVPYVTFARADQLSLPFVVALGANWTLDVGR